MNRPFTATDRPASRSFEQTGAGQRVSLQTSQFIARLVGPVLCAIGIGMLADEETYRALAGQFLSGYGFIYFSGILILLAGISILNAHHLWTRDWRVCITLLGWLFACVGTFRLIAPRFVVHVGGSLFLNGGFFYAAGLIFLALGAFLVFKGYAT
ncbi:MAG: hypothetical protein IRY89_11675 [Pseudolabrys sp.]|nr:hypothetical protein [Pseudolabrys sp.]